MDGEEIIKRAVEQSAHVTEILQSHEHQLKLISHLLNEALGTEGAHHKQWYLYKIAEVLSIKLPDEYDKGIAP